MQGALSVGELVAQYKEFSQRKRKKRPRGMSCVRATLGDYFKIHNSHLSMTRESIRL